MITTGSLAKVGRKTAVLLASGDSRRSANVTCWPAQRALEEDLRGAFKSAGWSLLRGSPEAASTDEPHGFISSQAMGREVFARLDRRAPLVIALAAWQYSHHVLMGLVRHKGPILLAANWSGRWPGLVGLLNLRASLTKAGVEHSVIWSEDFAGKPGRRLIKEWCATGRVEHDTPHVHRIGPDDLSKSVRKTGERLAAELADRPAIMGVFDEGCMGMYNAIIPDERLHRVGVFKERLSQSALYAAMLAVPDKEADAARAWLERRGMTFVTGPREATDLTDRQVREQLKMYIAAARLADDFGCDAIGIQYQQGLKDLCAASDLAEGLLNASDRPPITHRGRVVRKGRPILHFNEVDECAGLDAILTERAWGALKIPCDNTLHDLRWSDRDRSGTVDGEVWVFEISGAAPATHFQGGYAGAVSERQPPMYFRLGGGTLKGVSKPGEVVWSRVWVEGDASGGARLHMDIGRCKAVALPPAETARRWRETTPQWPVMHASLYGITRDQMMARHQSNHIQVAYAPTPQLADRAAAIKASMALALGLRVHACGENAQGRSLRGAFGKV
ncbi:MAG: fucose isomerase [Phycisphaeraceae bacterium]|nr:MAG: fucose isomerase [Phycisphaeraceae bacterium]